MNDDILFMKKALAMAKKGLGLTKTNPRVGCVITKGGKIISQGYHKGFGQPHAEIDAINNAKEDLKGSTLYCNLEPCSSYYPGKKLPPCSFEIIKKKIARVVIANIDTNPNFLGTGIKKLTQAGIKVDTGILKEQCYELNEGFFKFVSTGKTFVHIKYASTLDGKLSLDNFDSKWITSPKSQKEAHVLRSYCDGIIIGKNTLIYDNPSLNIRLDGYVGEEIKKIVLFGNLSQFPTQCNLIANFAKSTIIFTSNSDNNPQSLLVAQNLESLGVSIVRVNNTENGLDLNEVLAKLPSFNIMKVMVEGGAKLITKFISQDLFDKVSVFVAPKIAGGNMTVGDLGFLKMSQSIKLEDVSIRKIGDEVLIEGYKQKINYHIP